MTLHSSDPYDALAAMFLSDTKSPVQGPPATRSSSLSLVAPGDDQESVASDRVGISARDRARTPALRATNASKSPDRRFGGGGASPLLRVTAAVTGHLPVMAGLWATQYADRVGAVDGPTGLIRWERDLVHVELLRSGGRHLGLRQGESLSEWLTRAAQVIRRWVICIPAAEPGAAIDLDFADAVLLTSADEAAVAAAQRVVEEVGAAAAASGAVRSLGVVVVGAPPERVQWMADELGSRAPRTIDLPLNGAIQRMDRVESCERYGFEAVERPSAAEFVRLLRAGVERAVDRLNGEHIGELRQPPAKRPAYASGMAPAPMPTPTPMPTPAHAPAPTPVPAPAPKLAASAVPPVSVPTPAHRAENFAPHIPGLTALDLRCPVAPGIELAVDGDSRLHLVAPLADLSLLRAARAWALTNEALIVRAIPELVSAEPLASRIVERVVTLDATSVEALHGSGVALDLIVELRVGAPDDRARAHRHHVALNRAASIGP